MVEYQPSFDHPWFERGVCKKNTSDDVTFEMMNIFTFFTSIALMMRMLRLSTSPH